MVAEEADRKKKCITVSFTLAEVGKEVVGFVFPNFIQ